MISSSKKSRSLGGGIPSQTRERHQLLSNSIEFYALLIEKHSILSVFCKVRQLKSLTTVHLCLASRREFMASGDSILSVFGLNSQDFMMRLRLLAIERVSLKIKRLTRALQSWSQRLVGHIKTEHALAHEILHRLEIFFRDRCPGS